MADVFISYKRERRAHAERLAIIFEAHGFEVWWDHELLPAAQFDTQIETELDGAAAVVVLWCSGARQSKFVKSECRRADRSNKLVQTHIEEVVAPIGLDQDQSLSLIGWSGAPEAPAVRRLVVTIARLVGRSARNPSTLMAALEALLPPLPRVEPIHQVDAAERDFDRARASETPSPEEIEKAFFDTCSSADDFEAYLLRYPQGSFAADARRRVDELDGEWMRNLGITTEDWSILAPEPMLARLGTRASRAELERRSRRGSVEATTLLALKLYAAGDQDEAVALLRRAASANFAPAQARLGYILIFVRNSVEEHEEGARWTKRAAEHGNATAQNNYGAWLLNTSDEDGDKRKIALALKWYEKAANQGYGLAQYNLGRHLVLHGDTDDVRKRGLEWLNKASAQGETDAFGVLGRAYHAGLGTEANAQLAAQFFKKGAEHGDPESQLAYGLMLLDGNGVTKNEKRAGDWIYKAAEGGESKAFLTMARLYEEGRGVEKDIKEALSWYETVAFLPEAQERMSALRPKPRKRKAKAAKKDAH